MPEATFSCSRKAAVAASRLTAATLLLISGLARAGRSGDAARGMVLPPVRVAIVTHNEEPSRTRPDYLADQTFYLANRRLVKKLADTITSRGATYNFMSDWNFLQAVALYDTPAVTVDTNGLNIVRWLSDQPLVEVDPHAHESTYNYADVAYLIEQLGVTPSKTVGGFVYSPPDNPQGWEQHEQGIYGSRYPSYFWRADILWGAATGLHQGSDDHGSGIWRPQDRYDFTKNDPSQRLLYIGGCGQLGSQEQALLDLLTTIASGSVPLSGFYTASITIAQDTLTDQSIADLGTFIDSLDSAVATGRVRFSLLSDTAQEWQTEHGGRAFRYDCETGEVTLSFVDSLVGQGLGQPNANRVRVYTPAGQPTAVDLLAYSAGKWGVNVGSGDVDAASDSEILTGPGPGDVFGPQVRAFHRDGASIAKINFYAYGTLRYGVNVAAASVDSDAFDEILTGAGPGDVFGPHVRGFGYDGSAISALARISYFAYGTLQSGVNVAAGSVDSDVYAEILTAPGPGVIFAPQVRGWNYDGSIIAALSKINFDAFSAPEYGANPSAGDVDGDGFAEIAAAPGPGPALASTVRGFDYDGASIAALSGFDVTPFTTTYGARIGTGDVSGSGGVDLLAGAGRDPVADSTVKAYAYDGSALTLLSGSFLPFPGAPYGVNVTGGAFDY